MSGEGNEADIISITIRIVIFLIKYFLTCECQTSAQRGNGWRISVSYLWTVEALKPDRPVRPVHFKLEFKTSSKTKNTVL